MAFFKKITGGVDKKLLATGTLGQGLITDVKLTGTTLQSGNGLVQRACIFTIEVRVDGQEAYVATCKQRVPEVQIPQLRPGATLVAVRVDAADRSRVAIDFDTPPPVVTAAPTSGNHSAAHVLATGEAAEALIVESQPLMRRNAAGVDIYAFTLTVLPAGRDPYQIQVGNPVAPSALPFLFPGSRVPVKIGDDPNAVVIDWDHAAANSRT
jgi:hypothetical protein